MPDYDIGRLTSGPLTEVRTVLSRAETALAALDRAAGHYATLEIEPRAVHAEFYGEPVRGYYSGTTYQPRRWVEDKSAVTIPHPDLEEMRTALRATIESLRKWERTGAKKRPKK